MKSICVSLISLLLFMSQPVMGITVINNDKRAIDVSIYTADLSNQKLICVQHVKVEERGRMTWTGSYNHPQCKHPKRVWVDVRPSISKRTSGCSHADITAKYPTYLLNEGTELEVTNTGLLKGVNCLTQ